MLKIKRILPIELLRPALLRVQQEGLIKDYARRTELYFVTSSLITSL